MNCIYIYGKERFVQDCIEIGVDGLIIVDLPPEEDDEFYNFSEEKTLNCIRLITPTTNKDRLGKVLFNANGFVYYVSITGITGTQTPDVNEVSYNLEKLKPFTDLPIIIGFGIRTPEQASSMAKIADGIVVGSAVVDLIKSTLDKNDKPTKQTIKQCLDFIFKISKKIKHN